MEPWHSRHDFSSAMNNGTMLLRAFELNKNIVSGTWFFLAMILTIPLGYWGAGLGYPAVVLLFIVLCSIISGQQASQILPAVRSARDEIDIKNTPMTDVWPIRAWGQAPPLTSMELSKQLASVAWSLTLMGKLGRGTVDSVQ